MADSFHNKILAGPSLCLHHLLRLLQLFYKAAIITIFPVTIAACGQVSTDTPLPPFAHSDASGSTNLIRTIRPYSSKVNFEQVSLEEGLSQSSVNDILQDHQGLIWIATMDGLNRYDGYNIKVYKHDPANNQSLAENFLTFLYEDSQGTLWIGTEASGLDAFDRDTESFTHYRLVTEDQGSLSSDHVRSIVEDNAGDLWVGTINGLNKIDRESGEFQRYLVQLDQEVNDPLAGYVSDLHLDEDGTIWIGTLSGLLSVDFPTSNFQQHILSPTNPASNSVLSIYEDDEGLLWIGTDGGGLHMLEKSSGEVTSYRHKTDEPASLGGTSVSDIIQDPFGTLWVATENGLDRLSPDRGRFIHYNHDPADEGTLSDNEIRSLFVDTSGVMWVGTTIGGISKSDPFKVKFSHLPADPRDPRLLSGSQVWAIFEDSQGFLWIGTSVGLDRLNQVTGRVTRYSSIPNDDTSLPSSFVTDITEDSKGRIWISTYGGISIFDGKTETFGTFHRAPVNSDGSPSTQINELHFDNEGSLWIGTAGSGLDKLDLDTGSITNFAYFEGNEPVGLLPENYILAIYGEEGSPFLWLGTMGGLVLFDKSIETSSYYRHDPSDPNSLGHDIVSAIHPDGHGGLWLATGDGLDHFSQTDETFFHYREEDGLANNMVLGIEIDDQDRLWLSTNRGLSRFDPIRGTFRNFDTNDGLQSLEFNGGAHFKNDSGMIFFGGINGLNFFNPDEIFDNPFIPPVLITDFQILNRTVLVGPESPLKQSILTTDHIELSGRDSVFSFEIAALHYGSPGENQYAYIMEGFDEEWNYIGNRRFANYTNIPPGEYTFRAVATNNDGIWNLEGATVDIVIPLPFWQQWWFVGFALLLLVAAAVIAVRFRTRTIARRTRKLEDQVAARTAEIEQRRQIAEGLREILVILNTSPSLEESLQYIVTQAARLTDAEDTIIFRCPESGPITIVATNPGGRIHRSLDPPLLDLIGNWSDEKLSEREPLVISDLQDYWDSLLQIESVVPVAHSALLGIPLVIAENIYGGLLMFYDHVREFDRDDLELGFTFADQAALAIANNQLREQVKETATASERSRLARELHDAVTQTLFSASLIAETLTPAWENDPNEGRQLIQDLRQLTRGALAEMRTLLMELRPSALEEAQLPDLFNQLSESTMGRASVQVTVNIDNYGIIPANVRIALYRIAQESLNNVVKHSRAEMAELNLHYNPEDKSILLTVVDNGCGFDPEDVSGHHLGLNIIRERVQAIGAALSIESELEQGTKVTVFWRPDLEEE
jgi:ligand-binding sensor domain-containing protein/signal transduction histidine kinase